MYAVWYEAAGCLPDSEMPEFVGTLAECDAWVAEHASEYVRPDVVHDTYRLVVDEYEVVDDDA